MSNTNTPPRLYALTPIDQTEGLESREYIVVNKNGYPFLTKYKTTVPDGWVELDKPTNFKHYLRPLPEGTRVLKPGEVTVSIDELKTLLRSAAHQGKEYGIAAMKEWGGGYENERPDPNQVADSIIQTKLAQMGE